ncbi:MAG TPA: ABC transporter substrate-binding protein [Dehalococcoidia bacterium]|nr:ABC transporter substrate-binding protein [Dehalococcoidia bacterium]
MRGENDRRRLIQRQWGRRQALGLSAAGMAALGAACGGRRPQSGSPASSSAQGPSGSPVRGGTFTAFWNANPPSLDPQFFTTGATTSFACAAMSSLLRFKLGADPQVGLNHDLENDLAVSVESPDAATWSIKLRPDAKFHNIPPVNGHAIEAEDAKATYIRAVTSPQNPNRGGLNMVDPDKIETPTRDTIVFKLNFPYAPFPNLLASVQYGLTYPREVLTGGYDPSKQVIGSGPFVFDSYTPDVAVALKRNPDYYEKGLPYADGVRHAVITTTAQQIAQFTGGNLDTVRVPQNDLESTKSSNPKAREITVTSGGIGALYFQLGDPASPFQDVRLRRAVSMAIDRAAIGKAVYDNKYDLNFSVLLSMGKWALKLDQLDPSVQEYYKFNLPEAKRLVQEAGGANLNVKFAYPIGAFSPEGDTFAQTIYSMLSALPWKVTLVQLDYNKDFLAGGKGYNAGFFPADTILWGGVNPFGEADQYLFGYYHSKSATNKEHLNDPAFDALVDKARGTVDIEARRQAYLAAQKYLADKMLSVMGLPAGFSHTLVQSGVQDFKYVPETNSSGRAWSSVWLRNQR